MVGAKKVVFMAAVAGGVVTAASAQNSLTTLFTGGNNGNPGGAVYFDLTVGPAPLTITGFDVNTLAAAGSSFGFEVYTTPGTYVGNTTNQGLWTSQATGSGVAAGTGFPSAVTLNSSFVLAANTTYGVAIVLGPSGGPTAQHSYTNGNGTNQNYSNTDLSLSLGAASNVPFSGTPFTPRVWNGTVKYTIGGVTGACCRTDGTCVLTTSASCAAAGGIYRGDGSPCSTANCPQPTTGACCFTDGQCQIRTAAQCTGAGGTYSGDNTTCATANCPQPGACCFADGSCVILTGARCASSSGVYKGNGTKCATSNCWTAPVLWNNAKIVTNPGQGAGGADASLLATGANSIGENGNLAAGVRVADDFTVPPGDTWTLNKFTAFGYQTGSTTASTFTQLVLRIWDRDPADPQAVSLFGDITTNIMTSTEFSNIYRVTAALTDTQRPVMRVVGNLPNVQLGAGTYWLEWSTTGSLASGPFIPLVTVPTFLPTGNAQIWRNAPWGPVVDININTGQYPGGQPADLPFILEGTRTGGCYANCDGSTSPPILNVNDFICFQGLYAAQDPRANCDESTTPPVLNVNDFICFQGKYAAGCP